MKYVELIRGRDYSGRGVTARKGERLEVDGDKASELAGSGFFRILGTAPHDPGSKVEKTVKRQKKNKREDDFDEMLDFRG